MNPVLALIITNIIWGAAPPIFKFALTNIPPFTLAFLRFFLASLFLLPFIKLNHTKKIKLVDWLEIVLGAFFGITINISFFFLGLKYADSIDVTIIGSSGPLMLFFLSIIFLHEKFKVKAFKGMMLSLVGVLIIVFSPFLFDGKKVALSALEGNVMYIISTCGVVLMPIVLKRVLDKIDAMTVTFYTFIFAAVSFLPFMLLELQTWQFSQLEVPGVIGIIFGSIFSSAIAYYLYSYGISKIPAQEIGIFAYIDPVIAVVIAAPLVHEYPDVFFILGAIFVFGGISLAEGKLYYHPFHKLIKNGKLFFGEFL